jgi:DegV family protein with EDD domain
MPKIAIVTDSTASLPQDLVDKHNIHVIPCKVLFGNETFCDGVDLAPSEFYQRLRESSALPTTSQPSSGEFCELYESLAEEYDSILSIHVSEHLSGTLASAHAACATVPDIPIEIIDSKFVSLGLGMVLFAAARAVAEGKSAAEAAEAARDVMAKMNIIFVPDTLEYLAKGGRIGGASALLGSVLQIKPILYIEDGRIEPLEKVRSTKKARKRLVEIMAEKVGSAERVHAAVIHADCLEAAEGVRDEIAQRFDCAELYVTEIGSGVGTHAGPGTVGIAFYGE